MIHNFFRSPLGAINALVLTHSYPCKCPTPVVPFQQDLQDIKDPCHQTPASCECVISNAGNLDTFLLDYIWWFPKNSVFSPQIIHFYRLFHCKPSIVGYCTPIFGNTPYKLKDFYMGFMRSTLILGQGSTTSTTVACQDRK